LAPLSQKPQELGQICLKDPDMKLHLEFKGEKYYKIRLEIKILNFVYLGNDKSHLLKWKQNCNIYIIKISILAHLTQQRVM
jgi:hypothetical protein